jgi:bacterioferritin-associated ferredoxin
MIVCSCSMISAEEVAEAVKALRTADPFVVLTPGSIYRQLGKRPSCGSCLPLIAKLMVAYDEEGVSGTGPRSRLGVEEP